MSAYDPKTPPNLAPDKEPLSKERSPQPQAEDGLKARINAAMDWRNSYYEGEVHPADEFNDL